MEDKNKLVDASCFFLVEDSGDSELHFESFKTVEQYHNMDLTTATGGGGTEDDAESCSCDTISTERVNDFNEVILQLLNDDDDDDQGMIDCNDEYEDDEEPGLGINLCREVMELEGMEDRVFWETCMAIGYP